MDPDKKKKSFKSKIMPVIEIDERLRQIDHRIRTEPGHKAHPIFITLAILIPLIILGIILYMNFLPFGFDKTFVINVGSPSDTSGEFYLEQSSSLGSRQSIDDVTFRVVDGVVNAVFSPKPILRNVTLNISLVGEDVYFIKEPVFSSDYDFMEGYTVIAPHTTYLQFLNGTETNTTRGSFAVFIEYNATMNNTLVTGDITLIQNSKQIIVSYDDKTIKYDLPDYYIGKMHTVLVGYNGENVYLFVDGQFIAKNVADDVRIRNIDTIGTIYSNYEEKIVEKIPNDDCLIFDGKTRIIFDNTSNDFESGPFAVYLEWNPVYMNDSQQLIGHFNWEVWQNSNNVRFQVGRMYENGPSYAIVYPIDSTFFNQTHKLLAVYNPSSEGYIELYVDSKFVGRTTFGNETIWDGYGAEDLSLGWTPHNYQKNPYYIGTICDAKFSYDELVPEKTLTSEFNVAEIDGAYKIPIIGSGTLREVKMNVVKNE